MQKIALVLFAFISFLAQGQTTYLSTDYATQNESFIISSSTATGLALDFVQTGTNFNWDYSALEPASQETILYQNPNTAGYKTIWCLFNGFIVNCNSQFNNNFNLATKLTDGLVIQGMGLTNVIDHLKLTSTTLEDRMIGSSITFNGTSLPFVASYQNPDVLYQFPINYNDNYSNNFDLYIDLTTFGVPIQYASTGSRTNLVEGWGSLTTPFGTYGNVLKMKTTVVNNIIVTINETPTPVTRTTISYKWFDPAYGMPVLQVDGEVIGSQWIPATVTYFDIERCLTPTALFAFLPVASDFDPITNNASVSFINASNNFDTVSWDFGDGSPLSTEENPIHAYSCPGDKSVTLTVTNTFCVPNQVDTFTIPVTITDSQNAFTNGVTVGDASLFADRDLAGTTYQWLDCDNSNTPIPNETNQVFTPTLPNGNYAVQLTTNGCVSVSDCYNLFSLSINDINKNLVQLVPNPTKGKLELVDKSIVINNIKVYNLLGMLMGNSLDLSAYQSGIYLIKIETDKGIYIQRIIKE